MFCLQKAHEWDIIHYKYSDFSAWFFFLQPIYGDNSVTINLMRSIKEIQTQNWSKTMQYRYDLRSLFLPLNRHVQFHSNIYVKGMNHIHSFETFSVRVWWSYNTISELIKKQELAGPFRILQVRIMDTFLAKMLMATLSFYLQCFC